MSVYIIDLSARMKSIGSVEQGEAFESSFWEDIECLMDDTSLLWVFVANQDTNGKGATAMRVGQNVQNQTELVLKDIITVHTETGYDGFFRGVYEEILMLAKDSRGYNFNKDSIRVDPVYKGDEWNGLRSEGKSSYRGGDTKRYNSNGKDPGNVWLSEVRGETKSPVLDKTETIPRIEALRRCIRAGVQDDGQVYTLWTNSAVSDMIEAEGAKEVPMAEQLGVDDE